ncbi:MAG: hypothetical protein R2822_10490 [Spirosomataceae bacterium]
MRINNETTERIKQAADIVEVVSDFVSLKKRGLIIPHVALFTMKNHPLSMSILYGKSSSALAVVQQVTPSSL